jgi:putative transcriptional regulator
MPADATQSPYLTGQFLLAMPGMSDPRFARAVIAMCAHDADGAIGIGLGAVIGGLGLHELLDQFDIEPGVAPDAPVHFGGPVEMRRGFLVHSRDWSGQDTVDVAERWALSGTIDILRAIAAGSGPARFVVALGYAGWGAGQLEGELARPGWCVAEGVTDLLWDTEAGERWTAAYAGAGVDSRLLVVGSGTA